MSGKSALILGATGATGKHLLKELILSPNFSRVAEYGRRVTPLEQLPQGSQEKLEQKSIDYEKIEEAGLKNGKWDVVYITLGTTRATAGSAEAFKRIDHDYVVNAARAAKTDDPSHPQRLVYLSSGGSNPNSPFLYPKSKGQTELDLATLKYSDTIIFRPGLIENAERPERRLAESIAGYLLKPLSFISSSFGLDVQVLAKSICVAGHLGSENLPAAAKASVVGSGESKFTVIPNNGSIALGNN